MGTYYWLPNSANPTLFSEKDNWVDNQQKHPSSPPGAGDDIIVSHGGAGLLAAGGASVANAYLNFETLSGGLTVTGILTGLGSISNGAYFVGSIRRIAFQEAPAAGGGTIDILGLQLDSSTMSVGAIDLTSGGTVTSANNSSINVGSLAIGSGSASAQRGTFSVQSGSHATIAGTTVINNGTLNVGHITLGLGTSVELATVSLLGFGSMQVYAGAVAHVSGNIGIDDSLINLPGGLAGGVVVRGPGGALFVDGDVTVAATQQGLLKIMQGATANIDGALLLARDAGSLATMDVSSAGTSFSANGPATLGKLGTATLSVGFGGTAIFNDGLELAVGNGSNASVFVSGMSSVLRWSGDFDVGVAGTAVLSISSAGLASGYDFQAHKGSGDLNIRSSSSGSSSVIVSGAGARLEARDVSIGEAVASVGDCDDWTYTGKTGQLSVSGGGFAAIARKLTLDNADVKVGPNKPVLSLSMDGSIEVGGNTHAAAGHLVVDPGGIIEGHGLIVTPFLENNGDIRVHHGVLEAAGQVTGSGTFTIEEQCELYVTLDFQNNVAFEGDNPSILRLDDWRNIPGVNPGFQGTISGLEAGDTIAIKQFSGMPLLSHTMIDGAGDLVLTFESGETTIFDLTGDVAGHVFTTRYLPNNYIGLTYQSESSQVITGANGNIPVSGHPTNNAYLNSLITGFAKWNTNSVITYHFATASDIHGGVDKHGETLLVECDGTVGTFDGAQQDALRRAFEAYEAVTPLRFVETASVETANITFWAVDHIPGDPSGFTEDLGDMPDGHLWISLDTTQFTSGRTDFGGFSAYLAVHEIGHALGLSHSHDGGSEVDATTFPGVARGDSGDLGDNDQNQTVFTAMSYNFGWNGAPNHDLVFGSQGGPGAFDIAALQFLYGRNDGYHTGADTYILPQVNAVGTGWMCIWDAGGIDTLSNADSDHASTIDLRAAPLIGANAGGYLSYNNGVAGGFTIANGAIIENALGGNADDIIIGNDADNILDGGPGQNNLIGNGGADTFVHHFGATDQILDLDVADTIFLVGYDASVNFSTLVNKAVQSGSDTKIDIRSGDRIVISNTEIGALTAGDFGFISPVETVDKALAAFAAHGSIPAIEVSDSFATVSTKMPELEVIAPLVSKITFTDLTAPLLSISDHQYLNGLAVIDKIASPFDLQITVSAGATIPAPMNLSVGSSGGLDSIVGEGLHGAMSFLDASTHYSISVSATGTVVVSGDHSPTFQLSGIEFLQFDDKTIFIEGADNANIARLYSAALGRAPDIGGLSGWEDIYANNISAAAKAGGVYLSLAQTDNGFGLSIAGGFTQSIEFQSKYGNLTDEGFVTQLYLNVLGRNPSASELNAWVALMLNGDAGGNHFTREMVLVGFAESPENIAKTAADWLIQV